MITLKNRVLIKKRIPLYIQGDHIYLYVWLTLFSDNTFTIKSDLNGEEFSPEPGMDHLSFWRWNPEIQKVEVMEDDEYIEAAPWVQSTYNEIIYSIIENE